MITEKSIIKDLVKNFVERGVTLYHACQFTDFCSYLELGGIPSRKKLTDSGKKFTAFDTDETDKTKDVWDKVFVNLQDFGKPFAEGEAWTPNPYGPILLELNPQCLLGAENICITLRSAGAKDFDREKESLSSLEEVERIFVYKKDEENKSRCLVKSFTQLQDEFKEKLKNIKAANLEINLQIPGEVIPLQFITRIKVDKYHFKTKYLQSFIDDKLIEKKCPKYTLSRSCDSSRYKLYDEIKKIISQRTVPLEEVQKSASTTKDLSEWIEQLQKAELGYQYIRYANYLREGTLNYFN